MIYLRTLNFGKYLDLEKNIYKLDFNEIRTKSRLVI